jgi:hypothetical protein
MKKTVLLGLVLFLISFLGISQTSVLPEKLLSGWAREGPPLDFQGGNLFNYIDGGAEIFLEFGFNRLFVQSYKKGNSEIVLELFQMESPESALGIYLMKCGTETPIEGVPARNSGDKTQFTIIKGTAFIHINNLDGSASVLPAMVELSRNLVEAIPQGRPVNLLEGLPPEGRIPGTERLIRGPYALQAIFTLGEGDRLGLEGKIFALAADYKDQEGEPSTRILASYPDEARAAAVFRNLVAGLDSYLKIIEKRDGELIFVDTRGKFGAVERKGSQLKIKLNLGVRPSESPVP